MTPPAFRPWWLRKRVWFALSFLLGLAGALVVAVVRSNTSTIIVYNQTGSPIDALWISACNQQAVLRDLGEDDSFRWSLAPIGEPGDIGLETASNPPWRWQGSYVESRGGYRVTLRLWPNGEVESHTQISLWQRLVKGAPDIVE